MKPRKRTISSLIAMACTVLLAALLMRAIDVAATPVVADAPQTDQFTVEPSWKDQADSSLSGSQVQTDLVSPSGPKATGSPAEQVQRAWQRALDLGEYHFATSIVERRYPTPSLLNVGASPQQQEMWLEGDVNLPAHSLMMRLWQGSASVANPSDASEIRIEQNRTHIRPAGAEDWQPVEDTSSNLTTDNDLLSYLNGIKNVTVLGTEVRKLPGSAPILFTRYGFEMDGPALAVYMRDRLEQLLMEQGKLPPGVSLQTAREYEEMTGQGEVWLDAEGLPLRLTLHLRFPPAANGSYLEADVQSDYSGFPQPEVVRLPSSLGETPAWIGATASSLVGRHAQDWQAAGQSGLALMAVLGLVALIIVCRRSRQLYVVVVVAVILSMTGVPVLQNTRVSAFMAEQAVRKAEAEETLHDEQVMDEIAVQRSSWDPHRDPLSLAAGDLLSAAAQAPAVSPPSQSPTVVSTTSESSECVETATADVDNDGLTEYEECIYGTTVSEADSDDDGLNDGQEINYLGTSPLLPDADGDMITDKLEVEGFIYPVNGQHWYLDPRNPDTNGDGWSDGLECPPLWRDGDTSVAAIAAECDTNGDGIPNLFESDNEGDGVPDRIDISPNDVLDANGVRSDVTGIEPFNREQPFRLKVQDLQKDWPVFLDLQLRPEDPKHLTYALNVLDWPTHDTDGQIQHAKNTTFATSDNPEISQAGDETGTYGDMRLVPMLEIEMTGSSLPLKLTTPAVTATVASGSSVLSTTIRFQQDEADAATTRMTFSFGQPGTYSAHIDAKPCPGSETPIWSASDISSGQELSRTAEDGWLNMVADGEHALVISNGTTSACTNIPNIINGPYTNKMVDQSVLTPYGIGLAEIGSETTREVLAYVPLSTVSDDTGGNRVAFSARMLYWPGESTSLGEAQQIRMVWAVQALTDSCNTSDPYFPKAEDYPEDDDGEQLHEDQREFCLKTENRSPDTLQIIQTYDESFHITGLSMREDHGLDVAVAYPNPTIEPYDEDPLWQLSWGLGHSFVTGQDCENDDTIVNDLDHDTCHNDGVRDLTIFEQDSAGNRIGNSTISERFGKSDLEWKDSKALWGIDQGALQVVDQRYPTQDYLAKVPMEITPGILDQYTDKSLTPSLLFAREEHYRSAGLEAGSQAGDVLTLSVGTSYYEQTLAVINWAPFRYNSGPGLDGEVIGWEAYPMSEFYDTLSVRLKAPFISLFPDDDDETIAGQVAVAQGYYLSLYNGVAGMVHPCPEGEEGEACTGNEESKTIEELSEAAEKAADVVVDITFEIAEDLLEWARDYKHTHTKAVYSLLWDKTERKPVSPGFFKSLGHATSLYTLTPIKSFFASGHIWTAAVGAGMALVVSGAIVTIALSIALNRDVSNAKMVQIILLDVGVVLNTAVAVKAVAKVVHEYANKFAKVFEAEAEGAARHSEGGVTKSGVVKLVIQTIILWAAFFLTWTLSGLRFGSMAVDDMLASTIAFTALAILMFLILAVIPFGELIGAIIGAIDALVRLICNSFLDEEQLESEVAGVLCGGISGILKWVIKRAIYSGTIMVEMEPEDYERLAMSNFDASDLLHPELGVTYGNAAKYSIDLTNTIELADQANSAVAWTSDFFWDTKHLRKANFDYRWQAEESDFHKSLSLGGIPAPGWTAVEGESDRFEYHDRIVSEEAFPLPEPGIDQPMEDLYLSEAYALPEAECWGLWSISFCYVAAEKGTAHYPFGDTVKYDVLPASLDGFHQLQVTTGGYRLAWDPLFPPLHDADGDGLPFSADGDDTTWDADNDGLSDQYEVETGSNPALVDSDHDGLTDYQEAQLGTDPIQTDSDADGLYDCQEIFHHVIMPDELGSVPGDVCGPAGSWSGGWEFVYGTENGTQLITLVSADPTVPDADADNYSDSLEKIYGFNPGVPSLSSILTLQSKLSDLKTGRPIPDKGFVRTLQKLSYEATVKNELDAREAQGLMWSEGRWILQSGTESQSFVLMPKEEKSFSGTMEVSGMADTGPFTVTQATGALITNWREISGEADLWLPFDDATTATTFADRSGSIPANDGQCVGTAGSCSIAEGGGRYGSSLQFTGAGWVEVPLDVSEYTYGLVLWFKTTCTNCGIFSVVEIGTDAHDRHIYLNGGNICTRVYVDDPICTSGRNLADGQWHQVVHTFGESVGGQQIYVDGILMASGTKNSSDFGWQDGVQIGFSRDAEQDYFIGQIDDVRLYPQTLTVAEVERLFNQPVFHMNFEQHTVSGWKDVSGFNTPLAAAPDPHAPAASSSGVSGWAGEFETRDQLRVGDDSSANSGHLDLSSGKFTLSAWLRPKAGCTPTDYWGQLIMGTNPEDQGGWWQLRSNGPDSLGYTSGGIQFFFEDAPDSIADARSTLKMAEDTWNHLVVTYDKDAAQYGLVKFFLNGELKEQKQLEHPIGEHPQPLPSKRFYIGSSDIVYNDDPGFCGAIDEVAIYRVVMTDEAVNDLHAEGATALHVPFDEPPGTSAFSDTSILRQSAACSTATCPTAGVGGRIDQAASFNTASGHVSDHLVLPNSEVNSIADRMTIAAWIKLRTLSNFYQTIVSTELTKSLDGWGFGVANTALYFNVVRDKPYVNGANLQAGRWYHVAVVLDTFSWGQTLQFYVNGEKVGSPISIYRSILPDTADQLLIGAATHSGEIGDVWLGAIDDLTIYHLALTADQINKLYRMAPAMHLRFNENYGATNFANDADSVAPGSCSSPERCPVTGEGIQGQMWLAAQFDGHNDVVTLPDFGDFTETTVSAWIKRTSATNVRETVFSYKEPLGCGFVLGMNNDNQNQLPRFWVRVKPASGDPAWLFAESPHPVPQDSWQHLAGTYDGKTIRLYQNGSQVASTPAPGAMWQCNHTSSVGARASNDQHYFPGLIDEVQVFDHALTAGAIHDAYAYQNGWVEERNNSTLIVDREGPRGSVIVDSPPYQPNWPAQVLVKASDETSGVEMVQLCVGAADCSTVPAAPNCVLPNGEAAWCPTFSPSGQGIYGLSARITDKVGFYTTTASTTVYVDDSAPQVSLTAPADKSWYTAKEYQGKSNNWFVHFTGTVKDQPLSDTVAGSGVPEEGVRVTLYRGDGGLVGSGSQRATVSEESTWELDYLFSDADPSGCYKVVVEAVDRVARTSGLPDAQVDRHTTIIEETISVDADPTYASIDWSNVSVGQLGPDVTTLGGSVSARPIPVVLNFTGGTNSAQTELILTCQHGNEGSWWQPYSTNGVSLTPAQSYIWGQESKPVIHRGSSCQIQLKTSAATDDLSGTVTICGQEILNWSGTFNTPGQNLSFIADADSCGGGNGCPLNTEKATAGVQGVDVSYQPLVPGSAFYNEIPSEAETLHLTMDASLLDGDNPTFLDASANRLTGTCSGTACPIAGQLGHEGSAAFFDGADSIQVTQVAGQGTTDTLTASAWIYPTPRSDGTWNRGTFLSRSGKWVVACTSDGLVRWAFNNTDPGWYLHSTGFLAPLNQWTHIAVVYDNGVAKTYANGVLVDTYNGSGTISNAATLYIGGWPAFGEYFSGLLDDVSLFNEALSAEDVMGLYEGSGPVLVLPFDKGWAADSDELEDISGWQRDAVLHTGSGDTGGKAVIGQVGRYALQLDGVDDYVVIPDADAIDFPLDHDFAIALWVKPDTTQPTATNSDSDIVEKWTGPGAYPYVIRYINQLGGANEGKIVVARYDGTNNPLIRSTKLVNDGGFHHIAFVREAGKLKLYIDGMPDGETPDTTTGNTTNSSPLYIGQRGNNINHFAGQIDDLHIYPRSLSVAEIQSLFLMGWQPATIADSGETIESSRWEIATPAWLEGSYRIEARGWDTDGHTSPPSSPVQTWSGEADTLAPRVRLVRIAVASGYRYITSAEDYNLTADYLKTPCPSDTVTVKTNFQSPWYLAAYPVNPRLFQMVQECTLASPAADETATVCDTFGNCGTASVTNMTSILDLPAELQDVLAAIQDQDIADEIAFWPVPLQPDLDFGARVLTTTHLYPPAVVQVTGPVTWTQMIKDVTVSIGSSTGQADLISPTSRWTITKTWSYPWTLNQGSLPDGVATTAVVTATRTSGGKPIVKSAQLMVDVVPPSSVPLTLLSDGQTLQPGETVRAIAPELVLSWPAASDGSGVTGYVAHWNVQSADSITRTSQAVGTGELLEARHTAGEAQQLTVDLASRDHYGNLRWQEISPIYVDSPLTPDYIGLSGIPYLGWQESGCSLLGADRRSERRAPGTGQPQRLYASWDEVALRLAWTGASWSSDGDLFIYLDTGPGGTTNIFSPSASASEKLQISNQALQADYVVWVHDARTATLLVWNGSEWSVTVALSERQYRFDPGRMGGQTDLYLPFDLLNLTPTSSLGLVAVAAAEPVEGEPLQLWATLPQFNPVNSALVNRMLSFLPEGAELALKHAYRWPALGSGVCPNGSDGSQPLARFGDVHPRLSIQSDPPGASLSGLGRGLFWVTSPMLTNPGQVGQTALSFLKPANPSVQVGQPIQYTVRYNNGGTDTQYGVRLELSGYGIDLATTILELGDVAPGAEAQATFAGLVTGAGLNNSWAVVHGLMYDASHPAGEALEWLWEAHTVDQSPPDTVSITNLRTTIGPLRTALSGLATDESGVASVEVEITGPNGVTSFTCSVTRPGEGRWQCPWHVGGAPHGTELMLRVRATDILGHTSEWSSPRMVTVDAQPPDLQMQSILSSSLLKGGMHLFGQAFDESGIGRVQVCIDGKCNRARLLAEDGGSARWTFQLPRERSDYISKTISIYGTDRLGNRTEELQVSMLLDNVAPELPVTQLRDQVMLGDQQVILRGTVQDGGPGARVFVRVQAPDGTQSWQKTARSGDQWWYELDGDMPGRFALWLQAIDRADNSRTTGPFYVDVTCTDATLLTRLSAEREATGSTYLLTAVISNTGPAPLPAGASLALYVDEALLESPQPLPAIDAGQASVVTAQWSQPEPQGYEISAVLSDPPGEVLCATPPGASLRISPDVDLHISKTVRPATAVPGDVISYTLLYSNTGSGLATGVVISDPMPIEILAPTYQASGALITPTVSGGIFVWQVANLAAGQGGQIVISGMVDPGVTSPITITNIVTITSPFENDMADNVDSVALPIVKDVDQLIPRIWLPWITRR